MSEQIKNSIQSHFTVPKMSCMGLFTALAFVATFLEFPIIPPLPFLKLDFANVFFLLEGFLLGPVEAVVSIALKELLCLFKSQTAGVGELANFIMSVSYVIIPAVWYRDRKGKGWAIALLAIGCVMQILSALLVNAVILFPIYLQVDFKIGLKVFLALWQYILLFNAIKAVAVSVLAFFLYKPLSGTLKRLEARFNR